MKTNVFSKLNHLEILKNRVALLNDLTGDNFEVCECSAKKGTYFLGVGVTSDYGVTSLNTIGSFGNFTYDELMIYISGVMKALNYTKQKNVNNNQN